MLHQVIPTREIRGVPPNAEEVAIAASRGQVVQLHRPTRLERDRAEIEADRQTFIERRTAELLENRESFGELLYEITGGPLAEMAVVALRDACKEQGQCWDGISAFGDLIHAAARKQAAEEWPEKLLTMAPACDECYHGTLMRDPAGTGDSPSQVDCAIDCPWGKS